MFKFFTDFGSGGSLHSRLKLKLPDVTTTKLILVETIVLIEKLHSANILHGDICATNILIDSKGHLLLIDFGLSMQLPNKRATEGDWNLLSGMCYHLFGETRSDEHENGIVDMLNNMTDDRLHGE